MIWTAISCATYFGINKLVNKLVPVALLGFNSITKETNKVLIAQDWYKRKRNKIIRK